ncbi:MAG TPA: MliC family protein [Burkholderiaceae bacterium]|jgi:hypothetical protein|nr:MliC family protein [Burkholderiaceae bacterium]
MSLRLHNRFVASLAAAFALASSAAVARPATYQCGEDREVKIDFTPRKAQLHLGDADHTLQRVKSARDGHYVNHKAGYELIANKGDLRMREGKTEVQCKLKITP